MKIGDRDTPGSRIYAEREFRESAQVLVATEAAGEGINLQFCWLMINYDIPWNPVRLEQRVGRIHRYGQEHDCLIFNFVAQNTREGRVLQKLLERLREIRNELGHRPGVRRGRRGLPRQPAGEAVPRHVRPADRRARDQDRIVERRRPDAVPGDHRIRPGGAGQEGTQPLGHRRQDRPRRRSAGSSPRSSRSSSSAPPRSPASTPRRPAKDSHVYRVGKVPRNSDPAGNAQEPRFGRLGREYGKIVFDKEFLPTDPTLEWVTPGHPLFEAVRDDILARVEDHLRRGAVFYDLHGKRPCVLDVFAASIKDGRGKTLHRRLFVVETDADEPDDPPRADHPARHHPGPEDAKPASTDEPSPAGPGHGRAVPLRRGAQTLACRAGRAASRRRSRGSSGTSRSA